MKYYKKRETGMIGKLLQKMKGRVWRMNIVNT